MSKVSIAKAEQGYCEKPVQPECRSCQHVRFDLEFPQWVLEKNAAFAAKTAAGTARSWETPYGDDYRQVKNLRCDIGGFAIKFLATCSQHAFKPLEVSA